jgi:hypothetical protein
MLDPGTAKIDWLDALIRISLCLQQFSMVAKTFD